MRILSKKFSLRFKIILFSLNCLLILTLSLGCEGPTGPAGADGANGASPLVIVPDDYSDIQEAVDKLNNDGGSVFIRAGLYILSQGIHINKSNVSLFGEQGTIIQLDDGVNQPVVLIGTDAETPIERISDIEIKNIEIDGNDENQTSETDLIRTWIRNNAIDVRMVDYLYISNVNLHDAISGAFVVSWDSNFIFVDNSSFHNCTYDGIALYDSADIQISNFICYENNAAGLSLDNQLKNVIFDGGIIRDNNNVGIFVRNSEDISFHDLKILSNGSHGSFLGHETEGTNTGVTRLFFDSCSFLDNGGWGFYLSSTTVDSPDNTVIGCLFSGNVSGDIYIIAGGSLDQEGNIFQ